MVRIQISEERIAAFCRRHGIRRMELFGSVLRDDFAAESDIDVMVEFEPGRTPGFGFFALEDELGRILEAQGRPVHASFGRGESELHFSAGGAEPRADDP